MLVLVQALLAELYNCEAAYQEAQRGVLERYYEVLQHVHDPAEASRMAGPSPRFFLRVKKHTSPACNTRARTAAPHCGSPLPPSHCNATTADRTLTSPC